MVRHYLVKEEGGKIEYSPTQILDHSNMGVLDHEIRQRIILSLQKEPMFAAELAKKLKMHEQKVYYHIKQLVNTGILEEISREEIRGTIAKRYKPKYMNFSYALSKEWKDIHNLIEKQDTKLRKFFEPFIKDNKLDAEIVVGSPDPHGPYKSYARDGHYAVELAMALGRICDLPDNFTIKLDVDVKAEKSEKNNLIIVGGPGTNMLTQEINPFLQARFDIKEAETGFLCSGIISEKTGRRVNEEKVGLIAKVPYPYDTEKQILILAGYRCIGSKTAVMGLTRFSDLILAKYDGQKSFAAVVDGFDLDGDGKIDSVELIE